MKVREVKQQFVDISDTEIRIIDEFAKSIEQLCDNMKNCNNCPFYECACKFIIYHDDKKLSKVINNSLTVLLRFAE